MSEQMKPSGIDYIGDIPQSWLIGRVKNFYKILTGFTPDTSNPEYYDDDLGYDWITIADIDNAKYITETKSKISQKYLQEKHPIITPKGSLLYSFKLSVGKVAFAGKDIYTNEAIASFVEDKNLSLKFLYYSSALIIENANINIYGAKIMNQELIGNAPIVFPTLEEQRFIADFLDKQCGKIDGIISDLEKQIETLQKYKKSLILETVTKGLNKNVPMKSSGIDWIGDIPAHWETSKIKYNIGLIGSGTTPESGNPLYYEDGKYNWIQSGDLYKTDYINSTEKQLTALAIKDSPALTYYEKDFVVIAMYGASVGNVSISKIDAYTNQACCVIKAKNNDDIRYLFYYLKAAQDEMLLKAFGGTQPNISQIIIKNLNCLKVPNVEQKSISDYLDDKCGKIDSILKDKQEQLEKIKQHKKSLIYEYVTGKKRVKEAINGN